MIDPADLTHCEEAIRHGSLSFHAASRLLPKQFRDPSLALYAFCRLADDEVDLNVEKPAAVLRLQERLDAAYAGKPRNAPADRAFTAMIEDVGLPRALPDALIEGLAWDAMERRYETLSDLFGYSARVASAVGVMMSVIMGVRDANALARACDLGVAMQLTNIARDVGEDAFENRLYLPLEWMKDAQIDPESFLRDPLPSEPIRNMTRRLLKEANQLYHRGEAGIAALPFGSRTGMFAARYIYAGIGRDIARAGHDNITRRARTSGRQKLGWLMLASLRGAATAVTPHSPVLYAPVLPEVAFLVNAAADRPAQAAFEEGRAGPLVALLADLKARDIEMQLDRHRI